MSRIFREICFPWKLKDENIAKMFADFAAFFADLLQNFARNSHWGIAGITKNLKMSTLSPSLPLAFPNAILSHHIWHLYLQCFSNLPQTFRAATLQKCGSESFLRFFSAKGVVKFGVKFW